MESNKHKISILGCGWFGKALGKSLISKGYQIKGSSTSTEKIEELKELRIDGYLVDLSGNSPISRSFLESEILIVCIPPKKQGNYVDQIYRIADSLSSSNVKQVIYISSIGVFDDENCCFNESNVPNPKSDKARILYEAEQAWLSYPTFTTTIIRFGGLFGPDRNLAKHFTGKKDIPNGLAPINLIHLNDCIGISEAILSSKAFGHIYHGVAPSHPSRMSFYTQACRKSGLDEPEFKKELLNWKQIDSINIPKWLAYNWQGL